MAEEPERPKKRELDERVAIRDVDPIEALRALMATGPHVEPDDEDDHERDGDR